MKYIFFPRPMAFVGSWLAGVGYCLLLAHCQSPAVPSGHHLQCYVRFDAARGQVQADATARQDNNGLPGLPVEMPGGLLYQGSPMQILPVEGLTYRRAYATNFEQEHTFGWTDAQGTRQKLNFSMATISRFGFGDGPLLRTRPATLRWEGGALEKGEALVLMWENRARQQTVPMEIIRSSGDASIEFPAAKIAELPPGQWILYLVRKRLVKAEVPGMTATAVLEYYSKNDTIAVK